MSYTSQAVNNRSMNGIISFDDGSGGVLENGRLSCLHMSSGTSSYDTLQVSELNATNVNVSGTITNAALTNQLALKDDITSVNSKLALKLNSTNPSATGALSFNNVAGQKINYFTGSNAFTSSATSLESTAVRYNTSNAAQHVFSVGNPTSNGYTNIMSAGSSGLTVNLPSSLQSLSATTGTFSGAITSPTITNINTTKADKTYVDTQLLLKDDITSVDSKCLLLQDQIDDIVASEYYESINVGSVTTLEPEQPATVINSGTNINAILDFGIPRGYKGDKGDQGDRGPKGDDGSDGKDGSDGSNGSDGDSTAATAAAIAAAASAGAAAGAAGAAAGAASAAAGSAAASAASAAAAQLGVQQLQTEVTGLQTQVDTLGEGMTQLDNDVIQLKTKTQSISNTAGITSINSTLNTNDINANSLYVANSITVVDDVKASSFSGGLLSTQIKGSNINIGTNEALINTINIGSASTITTINGFVNFTNPFNNFFTQF